MNYFYLLLATLCLVNNSAATSLGNSVKKKDNVSFTGKLISQENPDKAIPVINIGFGRSKEEIKTAQIPLYEKPEKHASPIAGTNEIPLDVEPQKQLITTWIDLVEISKIEVPYPNVTWTYQTGKNNSKIEYIEIVITSNTQTPAGPEQQATTAPTKTSYLIELGRQGTNRPMRLFCDSVDKELPVAKTGEPIFCTGITKRDLREKGVPLQAIKELTIEGYCHKPPEIEQNNK
jgi:hypothetical protein